MPSIQLQGRIFLQGDIHAVTGLHIGGNSGQLDIGGIDNPVIRNAFNRQPYIPGSSLRGKMRSLLDRHFDNAECKSLTDYERSPVFQAFGVAPTGDLRGKTMPTRVIVRDTFLTATALEALNKRDTDTDFTEIKTEVAIDRITSAATPRQQERVPAGTTFGPFQIVHSLYTQGENGREYLQDELQLFDTVLMGMELLEDDYLGGSGSRGSGQIAFDNLQLTLKTRQCYEKSDIAPVDVVASANIKTLRQSDWAAKILAAISGE